MDLATRNVCLSDLRPVISYAAEHLWLGLLLRLVPSDRSDSAAECLCSLRLGTRLPVAHFTRSGKTFLVHPVLPLPGVRRGKYTYGGPGVGHGDRSAAITTPSARSIDRGSGGYVGIGAMVRPLNMLISLSLAD